MARSRSTGRSIRRGSRGPHATDVRVGAHVRERRIELGLSQEKLGEALGLTFQQIQKYERGANRISASRLYYISQILKSAVEFLYRPYETAATQADGEAAAAGFAEPPAPAFDSDPLRRRETEELIKAYFGISDAAARRRLLDLAKALGAGAAPKPEGLPPTRGRGRRRQVPT